MENVGRMIDPTFWKEKTVLITGHTGFKGSWLSIWLTHLGAKVIGFGLDPLNDRDNFTLSGMKNKMIDIRGDVRDYEKLTNVFSDWRPEIVFHMAAQPLVRRSYEEPVLTCETNIMGTVYVLECIRRCPTVRAGIMITTDKCYKNKERADGYKESDELGGYDPYSASKACDEIMIASYRDSYMPPDRFLEHGKAIASARAGNVIGGGDWAKDRIVPDCIRALETRRPVELRNPQAVRPWQFVLEPLCGYMLLAESLCEAPEKYAKAWNFGPEPESISTVRQVAEYMVSFYGEGEIVDASRPDQPHETNLLTLDIEQAKKELGWRPRLSLSESVDMTAQWYKTYQTEDVHARCIEQIEAYCKK